MRSPALLPQIAVSPFLRIDRRVMTYPKEFQYRAPPELDTSLATKKVGSARPPRVRQMLLAIGPPCGVIAVAACLRIAFPDKPDIFLDEVDYVDLSSSVRNGHYPPSFLHQGRFLLHPPLFFLLGGLWQFLVHSSSYLGLIASTRLFVSFFAVTSALLSYAIVRRLAGRIAGTVAGMLFGVEPYALRENAHVFLETPSMCFVLAGYLVLMTFAGASSRSVAREDRHAAPASMWPALGAGTLFGLAGVTLELTALITVVPLVVLFVTRWCLTRRQVILVLAGTAAPYFLYLASLAATHSLHAFYVQDLVGLERALGVVRITGFTSSAGSPSLVAVLLEQLRNFVTTYALVALAVPTAVYLLFFASDERLKLCGVLVACGGLMICYDGLFGTIEEQFLYVLLVPTLLAISLTGADLVRRSRGPARHRMLVALAMAFVAVFSYDLFVAVVVRSEPDKGVTRLVSYFRHVDHDGGTVSSNTQVVTDVLRTVGIPAVTATTTSAAAADKVRYLTVLSAELAGSYGSLHPNQVHWYAERARVVLSFTEPTYGTITVYKTTDAKVW